MSEEKILKTEFSDEMKKSYIDYSMSVITARAIPDIRDGLKPVQRRIIYDMNELGVDYNKQTRKSARIVGDTMGKYHPHGNSSIYESLVVMSQDFKKNVPLVYGQGNMGSIEGDGAAAERYTEAKLQKFSQDVLLSDIETTTDFIPNYDGTEKEPEALPAKLPLFLINGSEGIAVGMTTSTPSHNLNEVCELCKSYITNPKMNVKEMLDILHGPDFPTGGIIVNKSDLLNIYETGTGKLRIRGKLSFEKAASRKEHDRLVVTEIPFTMIGSGIEKFMQDVASLVENKKLPEIIDISNQSNKEGIRIVLELKSGADLNKIETILYSKTKLEDTFGVNMLAIYNRKPELMNLQRILQIWYEYQVEILTRKYTAILKSNKEKLEIQEGLLKACDCIDLIIEVIRGSKNRTIAKKCLMTGNTDNITFKTKTMKLKASKLSFTENQAEAILKMQLQRLIGLEITTLQKERDSTLKEINRCEIILKSKSNMNTLLKKELTVFQNEYSTKRKTEIKDCKPVIYEEKEEVFDYYFVMDRFRYCKFIDEATYERNKDTLDNIICFKIKSNSKIIFVTDKAKSIQIRCSDIPLCKFKDKGVPIENISPITENDEIIYICDYNEFTRKIYILITKNGMGETIEANQMITSKKESVIMKLDSDDLLSVCIEITGNYVILVNSNGNVLRLKLEDILMRKRNCVGIKVMDVKDGYVKDCLNVKSSDSIKIDNQLIKVSKIPLLKRGSTGKKIKKEV